jgi:transposase-like protein
MKTPPTSNPHKRHRFPAEVISHCVWLYFRFCLSYRDVEELMAERGVLVLLKNSTDSTPLKSLRLGGHWSER